MISKIICARDTKEKAALLRLSLSWLLVRYAKGCDSPGFVALHLRS